MHTVQFITDNPRSALEQIRDQLGPEAVVLSVRRLPAHGVARLWQKNGRVEILAGVPDKTSSSESRRRSFAGPGDASPAALSSSSHRWQTVAWLEAMGLLPAHAERLQNHLRALHPSAPVSLDAEWEAVSAALAHFWLSPCQPRSAGFQPAGSGGILAASVLAGQDARRTRSRDSDESRAGGCATTRRFMATICAKNGGEAPHALNDGRAVQTHVFIGPPGSGKTTVLCKWLTLAVLTEERRACVWRLDGAGANTAEFLTVHCEMLGVPVERFWSAPTIPVDLCLVDLPGLEADDARALAGLRGQLSALPSPEVHLVLNSAYETDVLLAQCHAFAALEPADLILTHLDEEVRRVKLWNLVFGTNCRIRFLSAGQKIPGEFRNATPGLLFPPEIGQ